MCGRRWRFVRQAVISGCLVSVALGCAAARQRSPAMSVASADTSLAAHLIREVASFKEEHVGRVAVDPRPLPARPDVYSPEPDDFSGANPDSLRVRSDLALAAGLDTISSFKFKTCQFAVPGRPLPTGCPADPITIVLIGMPRVGGTYFPGNNTGTRPHTNSDDRTSGAALRHVSVRVVYMILGPYGRIVSVYDFVVRRPNGVWETVEQVPLVIIE